MTAVPDYYHILGISSRATAREVKDAYRRLAKRFHPDICLEDKAQEKIVEINQAYEVLGDHQQRKQYDLSRDAVHFRGIRSAQWGTGQPRRSTEVDLDLWLKKIYHPMDRMIDRIITPLEEQLEELSADPFDDDLMAVFVAYIEGSQRLVDQSQKLFRSLPNPANVAPTSQNLYYCLNHLGDGLEQFQWFCLNYSEDYLHTGQEMFRRAAYFFGQAQHSVSQL